MAHMVETIETWVPVSDAQLHDRKALRWLLDAEIDRELRPKLSLRELLTGWRRFTSSDNLTGRYAVSWRAALERREDRELVETCPYCRSPIDDHDPDDDWPV